MEDDIETAEVLGADDVASAGPSAPGEKSTRRGVAGIFFVYKCAGAAADKMLSLEEVKRVALNKKFIMEKDVRAAKEQGAGAVDIPGTSKITDLAKEYAHGLLLIIDGKTDKARR